MNYRVYETKVGGRRLVAEVGRYAPLTNASVMVKYEETAILVHATASKSPREGIDCFPLSCEFEEKLYSVGKIPGGYLKREGRPSEKAILASRLMDRPLRPLFPKGYRNDVQIVASVMSVDETAAPDVTAICGASLALTLAKEIPFEGPIGAVNVGYVDGEYVINPTAEQSKVSKMSLAVAGTKEAVLMVEAAVDILDESIVLDAILFAHEEIKRIIAFIEDVAAKENIVKEPFVSPEADAELKSRIKDEVYEALRGAIRITDKTERNDSIDAIKAELVEKLSEEMGEGYADRAREVADIFKSYEKEIMRRMIVLEGLRPDGRSSTEIRPITTDAALLPRTHGSGYFMRGLTSALSITTLGALGEAQRLDGIDDEETKRFMHHYNFPQYSVGETGPMRGPNRRAIGHGALGEKALLAVIPSEEDFPYTIRVVSEVLSSNGSTSQASICASSLSMLDAGVPLKDTVAGIAMGLIKEDDSVVVLSDIQGLEDFLGDMDFKVAGTKDGVTAMQMDMKIAGIDKDILERALEQAKVGRMHILSKMNETLSVPRPELSKYAPRVIQMTVHPDKIREIIGPGGKVITKITAECNVKIDITDEGLVLITANDGVGGEEAKKRIEEIVKEVELNEIYTAKIVRIAKFGAFVELLPGKEALVHISQLTAKRLEKVEDIFKVGDEIVVKVIGIDDQGKVSASRKVLIEEPAADKE